MKDPIKEFSEVLRQKEEAILFLINFADFKRRNDILGIKKCDTDIQDFESLLLTFKNEAILSQRIGGNEWLIHCPQELESKINDLIKSFSKVESVNWGWTCTASKEETKKVHSETRTIQVRRAIRVLSAPSQSYCSDLPTLVEIMRSVICGIPVDQICKLPTQKWQCADLNEIPKPYCIFCESNKLSTKGGDSSTMSLEAHCENCGADLDFSSLQE